MLNAQNFEWTKRIEGTGNDDCMDLAVDALGNVYYAGLFEGMEDFDPGPEVFTLTSVAGKNIFISKLNSSGNFIWAKSISANNYWEPLSIRF